VYDVAMSDQPEKVTTKHQLAEETIGKLRGIAETLKFLGDQNTELGDRRDRLERQVEDLQLEVHEQASAREDNEHDVTSLRRLVDDFRLEIIDREELLEKVLGRYT
jgi:hypothetical protein